MTFKGDYSEFDTDDLRASASNSFGANININSCNSLRQRLRMIFDDLDFDYGQFPQYHPQECLVMAKDGPQRPVDRLNQITDKQWDMIDSLVAAHDKLLAAKI